MWRTSSWSMNNGDCVELASYRTSSHSTYNGNCVAAGHGTGVVGVRDTKQEALADAQTVLEFPACAWREFVSRLK